MSANDPAADPTDRLAAAIMEHLARFPDASDTALGARDWWLPEELHGTPLDEVERALWRLVAEGRLGAVTVQPGATLFSLAPSSS